MKLNNDLYVITAYSNMHVGSGDINYGVIDNLIQRDVLNNYPNINSSGLKGAIKEFFKNYSDKEDLKNRMARIFGSDPKEQDNLSQGDFRFFEANILSIPVRSDKSSYFMATCPNVVNDLIQKINVFGITNSTLINALNEIIGLNVEDGKPSVFQNDYDNALIEDTDFKAIKADLPSIQLLEKLFGGPLVVLTNEDFTTICSDQYLPVIARNNLEDGRSQNLWYEQVLPRATRLFFMLMKEEKNGEILDSLFAKNLVQIGANASIGYGFTKIQPIAELLK